MSYSRVKNQLQEIRFFFKPRYSFPIDGVMMAFWMCVNFKTTKMVKYEKKFECQ